MAIFSFSSLPWICQKRFAEICDTQTMLKFKQLSPQIQELSKSRSIIKRLRIGYIKHPECDRDLCKCLPGQCFRNIKISDIKNVEIIEELKIDLPRATITKEFIQSFSFIAPELHVTSFDIEFEALKLLLERKLVSFVFLGTIYFNNFDQEFEYLINQMANIKSVV